MSVILYRVSNNDCLSWQSILVTFYVMFQRENHFINKRLQKPSRLNLKYMPVVNNVNKTNGNRYNS
jgi:hypothetical protein